MAIHIQSGKTTLNQNIAKIQSVPFKIHADCDANVSKYFDNYVEEKSDNTLTASFRGYPLKGHTIQIPKGYKGIILHESITPNSENEDRKFYVIHNFNSFISWNWDKTPSRNDKIVQALEWIEIAEALHSPIMEE